MAADINYDGTWIHITFTGAITATDLTVVVNHVVELEGRLSPAPDRLVDLGPSTTMSIGYREIANLAHMRRMTKLANPIRTAMIVRTASQQGYARMFQTLNDHPLITIAVFSDRAAAEAWLQEPRSSEPPSRTS